MLDNLLTLDVSPYSSFYDIVVPKTHFLRQLTELCDFSFIYEDLEHLEDSVKEEARVGHKTADSSFYSYNNHIAMTDERMITACVVTSGEQSDGKYMRLLKKSP